MLKLKVVSDPVSIAIEAWQYDNRVSTFWFLPRRFLYLPCPPNISFSQDGLALLHGESTNMHSLFSEGAVPCSLPLIPVFHYW